MSKDNEAQQWLMVRGALSQYMRHNLPDGLRFEDGTDFKQCVADLIDELSEEVSA